MSHYEFPKFIWRIDLRLSDVADGGANWCFHHHLKGTTISGGAPAATRTTLKLSRGSHHLLPLQNNNVDILHLRF